MPLAPPLRAAAALAVAALAATACASAEPDNIPEVSGAFGSRPTISIPDLPAPAQGRTKVLHEGAGPEVKKGQVVVTDVEMKTWEGERKLMSSWGRLQPATVSFDGAHVPRVWGRALVGRKGGSRVLMVTPPKSGSGPHGPASAQAGPGDHMVLVFDLVGGYGIDQRVPETKAAGGAPAAPSVSFTGPKRLPTVGSWGADAPRTLDVRTLVEGKGPVLADGDVAVAQYASWIWGRDKPYRVTYGATGPSGMLLHKAALPPAMYEALKGTRVGSRLQIAVPAQYRKGFTTTKGGIAAPSAHPIFWVVDVLDRQDR
ncbi:FKBP-type peptidyl-prolyl cis-trans isomerase [Streptomyces sp. SID14478]|uniref:FKBP-type peptidyl-prolyl cis-trans isomerase n=1 Tax=Streptomyces sp. SID14478 TaxID=2706073 RepID=UPI0013DD5518|nr:FKBP-type peptidyl-prolyl cis-trans isomerase [Streptomyces sp. SID14478]NEB79922.1 FKBP-type peptidyl-prolyl cis-trans isomerase [Streptomyces sp. SID14478]